MLLKILRRKTELLVAGEAPQAERARTRCPAEKGGISRLNKPHARLKSGGMQRIECLEVWESAKAETLR
jgi:hypothetical protein